MRKFSEKQRELLSDKLADFGNLAVASLVFGVVLRAEAFTLSTIFLGLILAIISYSYAIVLEK